MKKSKRICIPVFSCAVLFLSGGCGNPLLKSLQESLQETESHSGDDSQTEEETPLDNEYEDEDGYDINGNSISIHYFQSKSGKVFDVKVKRGWSN